MTQIEWTHRPGTKGESWNFIGGCSKVSPACDHCYALSMSWRIQNMEKRPGRYEGVVESTIRFDPPVLYHEKQGRIKWSGRVNLDWDALEIPYRWKKPRTVFVQSMGDLFHEKVPGTFIMQAFDTMAANRDHVFVVLTKRADRMLKFFQNTPVRRTVQERHNTDWPLPNVWLMVTAENQEQADLRIPFLLQTPAAVRGVSVEPLLAPIDLNRPTWLYGAYDDPEAKRINWVVVGCESGPNRRKLMNVHVVSLLDQCRVAGVPAFVKQLHRTDWTVSKDPSEWPTELRRREWPR